jgi:hypothetical protein
MPFEPVETPISSPDAFGLEGDAATLSAAAVLLALGFRLRGDEQALTARASEASHDDRVEPLVVALPAEDVEPLRVPPLRATGERIDPTEARSRYPADLSQDDIREVAERFHTEPMHARAAELFEACLGHPEELVRVAAASSYLEVTTDPQRPVEVLREALGSEEELARDVAATSLAHFMPDDPALARLLAERQPPEGGLPATTCMLVHGTFAQGAAWWQPGGDFHHYFKATVRPDLYSAADRFWWSGGYTDAARAVGAVKLGNWVTGHNLNGLDLVTHSHGGSVAMRATQAGLDLGELVLLSCPVHIPKYVPRFAGIGKIVSIRVHMDLVILADRGGQRFRVPEIDEHVLPIWFTHSATHEPNVWQQHVDTNWL